MYYYLIHIQYLGFRYHGWRKQPGVKTIETMVEKTIKFILKTPSFKLLGSSRTDAKVSAAHYVFELFVQKNLDLSGFLEQLDDNLPNDIRALGASRTNREFNILQAPRQKEYVYLFSSGGKAHPFCAPLMVSFREDLDIELMKKGAALFKGTHDFRQYCTKPGPGKTFKRKVEESRIMENKLYTAGFFPEQTWMFMVRSKGFLRHQVRLMMGQLLRLGSHEIGLEDIRLSLEQPSERPLPRIAPASGLILNRIVFDQESENVSGLFNL